MKKSSQNEHVVKVLKYMDEHLDDSELSLKSIASEALFLHPDYLGKLFKNEYGIKFTECLLHKRMVKAQKLLQISDDSIADIAEKCGYSCNQVYFSKLFRQQYGVTPKVFRKMKKPMN